MIKVKFTFISLSGVPYRVSSSSSSSSSSGPDGQTHTITHVTGNGVAVAHANSDTADKTGNLFLNSIYLFIDCPEEDCSCNRNVDII